MKTKILSVIAIAALAASPLVFSSEEQVGAQPGIPKSKSQDDVLKMVMVDQGQLSGDQREAFQRYLQTADLPRTKVGKRCQYYGKPQVWCLLLDPGLAEQVYQKLKEQSTFGKAVEIKEVRRIREAGRGR